MITQVKLDYINRVIDECLDGEALELKGKFIGDEGVEALVQTKRIFDVENLDLSRIIGNPVRRLQNRQPLPLGWQQPTTRWF